MGKPGRLCQSFIGLNLWTFSTVLMTLYMGGYLLSTNQLSAGEVMSFLISAQTIQRSLTQVSLLFGSVIKGLAAGGRVFEVKIPRTTIFLLFIRSFD